MKNLKKYLYIILLYTNQSYCQYISSYNSIGSNFIGLSPCLRTMSADNDGNIYYSDICRGVFTFDGKNISPNIGQAGIQQTVFIRMNNKNINYFTDFQTFAYNVNKSNVAVQEVITLALPSGRLALIYNFNEDVIGWVDTLKATQGGYGTNDIAISIYKDNVRLWTKQSRGLANEYIISATYDEQENIYLMGWFQHNPALQYDTLPAKFDTLKFYPSNYIEDPHRDFKNYFIVSYDANGKLRWGKKFYGSEISTLGKLTYKQGRGLLFDITSGYVYMNGKAVAKLPGSAFPLYCHVNLDTGGNLVDSSYVTTTRFIGTNGGNHCEVPYTNTVYCLSQFNQRMKIGKDSLIPTYEYLPDTSLNAPEIYLAKKVNGQYTNAKSIAFYTGSTITEMQADSMGRVYLLGHFSDTFCLDSIHNMPKTKQDIFLACYDSNFNLLWLQTGHGDSGTKSYASGMAIYGNRVTINGYVNDTFYWEDQYMDHENFMHMFMCRFEVYNTGVKMVDDPRRSGAMKVWPNPTKDIINIQHDVKQKEEFVIYNILGEVVHKDYWLMGQTQRSLDVATFAKGIYIIRIGEAVQKVVVE